MIYQSCFLIYTTIILSLLIPNFVVEGIGSPSNDSSPWKLLRVAYLTPHRGNYDWLTNRDSTIYTDGSSHIIFMHRQGSRTRKYYQGLSHRNLSVLEFSSAKPPDFYLEVFRSGLLSDHLNVSSLVGSRLSTAPSGLNYVDGCSSSLHGFYHNLEPSHIQTYCFDSRSDNGSNQDVASVKTRCLVDEMGLCEEMVALKNIRNLYDSFREIVRGKVVRVKKLATVSLLGEIFRYLNPVVVNQHLPPDRLPFKLFSIYYETFFSLWKLLGIPGKRGTEVKQNATIRMELWENVTSSRHLIKMYSQTSPSQLIVRLVKFDGTLVRRIYNESRKGVMSIVNECLNIRRC